MKFELTNLLSSDRIRAFRRQYFMRLGTVLVFAGALLVGIQAVLLAPTFIYANEQAEIHRARIAGLTGAGDTAGERSVSERLALVSENATRAVALSSAPTASAALRGVLALPRPGILVTRFALETPKSSEVPGRMTLSGVAASRDALRQYHAALRSLSFVTEANLPLGAYALDSEIPFTITITGSLAP